MTDEAPQRRTRGPHPSTGQLAVLAGFGQRRRTERGAILYARATPPTTSSSFSRGAVDIVTAYDGQEELLLTHGPGRFLCELNL